MGEQRKRSGTPTETAGAAAGGGNIAEEFFRFISGGGGGADPRASLLGVDPGAAGVQEATNRALADPTDRTRGLFAALEPIEARETERGAAAIREMFGALGSRFSTPLAREEGRFRADLSSRFGATREAALLDANAQQIQAIQSILSLLQGTTQGLFDFAQPGPAVFEPSTGQQIASGALDLGRTGAAALLGGAA